MILNKKNGQFLTTLLRNGWFHIGKYLTKVVLPFFKMPTYSKRHKCHVKKDY